MDGLTGMRWPQCVGMPIARLPRRSWPNRSTSSSCSTKTCGVSLKNIEAGNPIVEINVVDPIKRKGYRFKGPATVHREGTLYEAGLRFYQQRSGLDPCRIEAIVIISVEQVAPLVSPAYDDGSTEDEVEQRSLKMYRLERLR